MITWDGALTESGFVVPAYFPRQPLGPTQFLPLPIPRRVVGVKTSPPISSSRLDNTECHGYTMCNAGRRARGLQIAIATPSPAVMRRSWRADHLRQVPDGQQSGVYGRLCGGAGVPPANLAMHFSSTS